MKKKELILLQRDQYLAEKGQLPVDFVELQNHFLQQKQLVKVENLKLNLSRCGKKAKKEFYCKKCGDLLKVTAEKNFYCEIRYCNRPSCMVHRFASTLEELKTIKDFDGLRTLWHFSVGFESIPLIDFKQNFTKYKKRQEYVMMKYFKILRDQGIDIKGIRVLDFSFVTAGMVYMHYHFGVIPVKRMRRGIVMKKMKAEEKAMISRMKVKTPFFVKFFKHAGKQGVLSYFSIRSAGMYKYDATTSEDYRPVKIGNLKKSILAGNYMTLNDVMDESEYIRSFYGRQHYTVFGGVTHPIRKGSNITLNSESDFPESCKKCGILGRNDIRMEVIFSDDPPPDENG